MQEAKTEANNPTQMETEEWRHDYKLLKNNLKNKREHFRPLQGHKRP